MFNILEPSGPVYNLKLTSALGCFIPLILAPIKLRPEWLIQMLKDTQSTNAADDAFSASRRRVPVFSYVSRK